MSAAFVPVSSLQAIEALFRNGAADSSDVGTGFVVANDASPARCQMLLRRCAALGEMCSQVCALVADPKWSGAIESDVPAIPLHVRWVTSKWSIIMST